jgi:hypothetical protein
MSKRLDLVVFRKWKDTGDLIALFPELPSDSYGVYCDSYEHVGQHAAADYYGVIRHTMPAVRSEYRRLAAELRRIGYRLRPLKRASSRHHERRRNEAKAFRERDTP